MTELDGYEGGQHGNGQYSADDEPNASELDGYEVAPPCYRPVEPRGTLDGNAKQPPDLGPLQGTVHSRGINLPGPDRALTGPDRARAGLALPFPLLSRNGVPLPSPPMSPALALFLSISLYLSLAPPFSPSSFCIATCSPSSTPYPYPFRQRLHSIPLPSASATCSPSPSRGGKSCDFLADPRVSVMVVLDPLMQT